MHEIEGVKVPRGPRMDQSTTPSTVMARIHRVDTGYNNSGGLHRHPRVEGGSSDHRGYVLIRGNIHTYTQSGGSVKQTNRHAPCRTCNP